MPHFPFVPSGESRELAEDIHELFDDLAANLHPDQRAASGECRPALDVFENSDNVEIVMDLCGIRAEAVRILFRAGVVVVVGEKAPSRVTSDQTFHLVEREFGRFSRAVRVAGAFDVTSAHATLQNGELIIVLPKLLDRRGRAYHVQVASGQQSA